MLRRLAPLLAIPLLVASTGAYAAKPHPVQRTIVPRSAVHYYRAKPPRSAFTQAHHHARQDRG
jgi:hypothetical protein